MIEIVSVEIEGTTDRGRFAGELKLDPGLNVLSAENAYGKTLAITAIPWCLGLEPMFGLQDNDAARFPAAVRDVITLGSVRDVAVLSSHARITLRRHDGAIATVQRPIKGGDSEVVEVRESTAAGASRTSRLHARRKTMADEVGGLQRFLFEWLDLPTTSLMTLKGSQAVLYLENITPLFFIDQNEGWTDLQALQVYRYGLQEIGEAAVEYLLGARDALAARFQRQQRVSIDARLKSDAENLEERVVAFFRRRGWTAKWSAFGAPTEIAKRWSGGTLTDYARDEFRMDVAAEKQRLNARIVSLRNALSATPVGSIDMAAASQASQQVVELKTRRHQLRSALRDARMLLADHGALLSTIEHRIHSSKDVLRLKTQGIGRLELVECPTCHRGLDPSTFQLTEQSSESVAAHIEALTKQKAALITNIAATEKEVTRLSHDLVVVDDTLLSAGRALETVNQAVGTTRETLAKVATDLAAAERELDSVNAFAKEIVELEGEVKRWLDEVRATAEGQGDQGDLGERMRTFAEKLRARLLDLGHSAVNEQNAALVHFEDRYVPYLGSRRLRSLGSASDHARLVAAYTLALADASRASGGPHPGFVILDEPLQQNPDPSHRELMVRFLEQTASRTKNQVIVTTSLRDEELAQLKKAGVRARTLSGAHFLSEVPDAEKEAAGQ